MQMNKRNVQKKSRNGSNIYKIFLRAFEYKLSLQADNICIAQI